MVKITHGKLAQALKIGDQTCVDAGFMNEGTIDFDTSSEENFMTGVGDSICYWDGETLALKANTTLVNDKDNFTYYGERLPFSKPSVGITYIKYISSSNLIAVVDQSYSSSHFFEWSEKEKTISYKFTVPY